MSPNPPRPTPAEQQARREREALWLEQIARGGREGDAAFARLVDAYEARVLRFCMGRLGLNQTDAEDLLQDLWLRLHQNATTLRPGATPSAWIWITVRNLAADAHRDLFRARRQWHGRGDDEDDPLSDDEALSALAAAAVPTLLMGQRRSLAADDCVQRQLQVFSRTQPEAAMALRLRHLEQWGIPELGEYLERSEMATRTFLHTVRHKVRELFSPCLELRDA